MLLFYAMIHLFLYDSEIDASDIFILHFVCARLQRHGQVEGARRDEEPGVQFFPLGCKGAGELFHRTGGMAQDFR